MREDPRSTEELIRAALDAGVDDDARLQAVMALHWRATPEVFHAAERLCRSDRAGERCLGADVLGQLGVETRPYREVALPILIGLLDDPDNDVANSAAVALGHHHEPRAVEALVAKRAHPSEDVRYGVVFGLLGLEDPRAIDALIQLSQDQDAQVRDWATFGLGTQIEVDTPAVREALTARLDDPDPQARGEALVGLARRGDPRVVKALVEALSEDEVNDLVLDAGELVDDPRVREAVAKLYGRSSTRRDSVSQD